MIIFFGFTVRSDLSYILFPKGKIEGNIHVQYIVHVCSDRILTFGIRSIRSPAKVGIGYYKAVKLPAW